MAFGMVSSCVSAVSYKPKPQESHIAVSRIYRKIDTNMGWCRFWFFLRAEARKLQLQYKNYDIVADGRGDHEYGRAKEMQKIFQLNKIAFTVRWLL